MEIMRKKPQRCQLLLRGNFTLLIVSLVSLGFDLESLFGGRRRDQFHEDLMTDQGFSPPVLGNVAKHPVLNFVPLAGGGRKMAHVDLQPGLVTQLLQAPLPEPAARTITPAAIGGDEQLVSLRVLGLAHHLPPASNRLHSKFRSIMVTTHANPALVTSQIVNTVRNRSPQFFIHKIVNLDLLGRAFETPFPP